MAKNILLLNGPNLNLLGSREPHIYGKTTLDNVVSSIRAVVEAAGGKFASFQSNHEGDLIDRIHQAKQDKVDLIVINPGGLTHTSVSLRDALSGVNIPFYEVHISNIHQREPFRHHSYLSPIAEGVICGFGTDGYRMAVEFALKH
ncbi:type II 3-dehydroquinate dehydratase [Oxalobacter paraformigenes]|uniref:3-dehydroquinate dehydratase n=1 Tax=Oxalobacter paraformigenes TaxID=556268 RepID=C3X594_9BURK|nr:type II 3-dehydroquinate dehydratase [Oxalobacter paraformigenes]EEO28380.1 3-dehydroquinate dehydratase [Oxalobacter paraformigenes]